MSSYNFHNMLQVQQLFDNCLEKNYWALVSQVQGDDVLDLSIVQSKNKITKKITIIFFHVWWQLHYFGNVNFFPKYMFQISKLKEITKEGKIQNLVKPTSFLLEANPQLQNRYLILTTFFYPIVSWNISLSIFAKGNNKKCCEGFFMLEV